MGRRERKKLERRERIFQAALSLFLEKGFDATTVEEIAERADVAKGTVFNYFPNKRAFLASMGEEWMAQITADLGPIHAWTGSAREQLGEVALHTAQLAAQHRELARLVVFESMREAHAVMGAGPPEGDPPAPVGHGPPQHQPGPPVHHLEALARQVVVRAQEAGGIRAGVDPAQAASLIGGAVSHTLIRWLVQGGPVEEMRRSISGQLDIIFAGLSPRAEEEAWEGR